MHVSLWFQLLLWPLIITLHPPVDLDAQTTLPLPAESLIANEALVNYPQDVLFHLEIAPEIEIVAAELIYDVQQTGCLEVSAQVPVTVDGPVFEWEWVMIRSGNPPPGSELWWEWRLESSDGRIYHTPRQQLTFSDDRFNWQTIRQRDITLHWYDGEDVGPLLLEAAVAGLALLEGDLGIELADDVEIYIYGSAEDMRDVVLYIQDWAGGVAFSEYNTILIGVPPSLAEGWGQSTIRHELAHLVVGQFGRSCVGGRRPTWLEEGLAMFAEGEPAARVTSDLENAIENDLFLPLRSLNNNFPAHGDEASLAYSQSYSVIHFLQEAYGQDLLQELLLSLAGGVPVDQALERTYGFNVDGLELAWRQAIGAPSRVIPPTPTRLSAAAVPTVVPISEPHNLPTPQPSGNPPSASPEPAVSSGFCAFGLVPLALLGLFLRPKRSG